VALFGRCGITVSDQTLPDGTKRSAYGGNYGEKKHDGNFVCDGMFFPDRTPKPAMQEFKYIAAPVFIKNARSGNGSKRPAEKRDANGILIGGAKYEVFNKFFFIDLSGYKLRYEVTVDGLPKASGNLKLPAVKPRKAALISIPATALKVDGAGERFLTISLIDMSGNEVAWEQFALKSTTSAKPKIAKVVSEGLIGFDLEKIVDKQGNLNLPEQVVAPQLTLWRAPTDNDAIGTVSHKWNNWGLRDLKCTTSKVTKKGKSALVTKTWKTSKGIAIKHTQKIDVMAGQIKVTETVTLPKQLDDVARIGINFELNGALENYEYFGVGPHEVSA
jgi:beta-galactosidase